MLKRFFSSVGIKKKLERPSSPLDRHQLETIRYLLSTGKSDRWKLSRYYQVSPAEINKIASVTSTPGSIEILKLRLQLQSFDLENKFDHSSLDTYNNNRSLIKDTELAIQKQLDVLAKRERRRQYINQDTKHSFLS